MESAILHNIRCLSFSVVYKCRRIPSYDLKYTLTSLSSNVDREYSPRVGYLYYRLYVQQYFFNILIESKSKTAIECMNIIHFSIDF